MISMSYKLKSQQSAVKKAVELQKKGWETVIHQQGKIFWLLARRESFGVDMPEKFPGELKNPKTLFDMPTRTRKNPVGTLSDKNVVKGLQLVVAARLELDKMGMSMLSDHLAQIFNRAYDDLAYVSIALSDGDFESVRFNAREVLKHLEGMKTFRVPPPAMEHLKKAINIVFDIVSMFNNKPLSNPRKSKRGVLIYDEILYIVARKGQAHKCDSACKKADHTYKHKFEKKHAVIGESDGTIRIQTV